MNTDDYIKDGTAIICINDCSMGANNNRWVVPKGTTGVSQTMTYGWGVKFDQPLHGGLYAYCNRKDWRPVDFVEQHHGLDTAERVCFYEQEFYPLSNFSAFNVIFEGLTYATSEHCYHFQKFAHLADIRSWVRNAPSAHEAFKIAQQYKDRRRPDWDDVKVDIMRRILVAKVQQHDYVKQKLLQTGNRELVENSCRYCLSN